MPVPILLCITSYGEFRYDILAIPPIEGKRPEEDETEREKGGWNYPHQDPDPQQGLLGLRGVGDVSYGSKDRAGYKRRQGDGYLKDQEGEIRFLIKKGVF